MSRPAISKHLRLLHSAGLVATRKQGTANFCSLQAGPLRIVEDWVGDYSVFWNESLRETEQVHRGGTMKALNVVDDAIVQELTIVGLMR
jgi:DNA-binding transcriptional ArsR family regulator